MKTEPEKKHKIQSYIEENCANVQKLDKQLTYEQAEKLSKKYTWEIIEEKLLNMENMKNLHKRYISVYLTLNAWISR
jgi:CRISPR/Cas system CSM-associated protein Csm5 (group 7 of RAMP superfamily)